MGSMPALVCRLPTGVTAGRGAEGQASARLSVLYLEDFVQDRSTPPGDATA